jgi:putative hydrolase
MAFLGDYHVHSINSRRKGLPWKHATGTLEEIAQKASELGLKEVAITDHGFNQQLFCTYRTKMPILKAECARLEEKYSINVLLGIEANIISVDGKIDVEESDLNYLDIVLCGFHNIVKAASVKDKLRIFTWNLVEFVFRFGRFGKKAIEINTNAFIKAVENNKIDVLTHLNFGFCHVDVKRVAEAAAKKGTLIELNCKSKHFSKQQVLDILQTDALFIVNSDAHNIDRIAHFQRARDLIKECDIPKERVANWDKLPNFINYKRK